MDLYELIKETNLDYILINWLILHAKLLIFALLCSERWKGKLCMVISYAYTNIFSSSSHLLQVFSCNLLCLIM